MVAPAEAWAPSAEAGRVILRWRPVRYEPLMWRLYFAGDLRMSEAVGMVQPMDEICPDCWAKVDVEYVDVGWGGDRHHGPQGTPRMCPRCHGYETRDDGWIPSGHAEDLPKAEVRLVGMVRRQTQKDNAMFFIDRFKTVALGNDPKVLRRRVYWKAHDLFADRVERALTGS